MCVCFFPQPLLIAHVTSGCAKSFLEEFFESFYRENTAFWEVFCFRISLSSLNTQLSTFGAMLLWDRIFQAVARWRWLLLPVFFSNQLFEVTIVTLPLRCYLKVVFCLISPDFATRSLSLHEHLVIVVVRRLSTFANLALRSSALVLFYSHKTCLEDFVFFHALDIPLRLISFELTFSASIGRIYRNIA